MTSYDSIFGALKNRKRGLTLPELEKATQINANTLRRALSCISTFGPDYAIAKRYRRCRVSGKTRIAYTLFK